MKTIQHPTKPAHLECSNGNLRLYIGKTFAGHITSVDFPELDARHLEIAKQNKIDPATQRMIGGTEKPVLMGPDFVAWLKQETPALLEIAAADKAEYDAKIEQARAEREAIDQPLIAAMDAEAAEITANIPTDCIRINVQHKGDFDGYPTLDLSHNGVPMHLSSPGVHLGAAHAIRPGAMGSFASRYVAWATPEAIDAATQAHLDLQAKQAAAKIEQDAKLNSEVPAAAIAAYTACNGNPENFPGDIDDPRYWLVRNHAAAIEHQGLGGTATLRKLESELKQAAREDAAQYAPGA